VGPQVEDATLFGLCAACRHGHRVRSARGSTFLRCRRAASDPTYARYPRVPVLRCRGFEPEVSHSEEET